MSGFFDNPDRVRKTVVLLLTLAVSVIFFHMIRGFMIALFLAAVFTGMTYPLHHRILVRLNGRRSIAAMFTLMIVTLIAVLPLLVLLGVVAEQGLQLSSSGAAGFAGSCSSVSSAAAADAAVSKHASRWRRRK